MSGAKHVRPRRRVARALAIAAGVVVLVVGGAAAGAYAFERANSREILPGVTVDGIDVGGMTRTQAEDVLSARTASWLQSRIAIKAGGGAWDETPAQLGASADVSAAVDAAFNVSVGLSWPERAYHRITGRPVNRAIDIPYSFDASKTASFVRSIAQKATQDPVDASIHVARDGSVAFRRAQAGHTLAVGDALRAIEDAVDSRASAVSLPIQTVQPKVPNGALGKTIVVRVSRNELYLYDGFKIERKYPVATAMPGFTTPLGSWHIVAKLKNPTWINPAPNGWGASEPRLIPPGPGDPLGTRALALNAPAIYIHGTPDAASVGTYASHGCIRMYIKDSEQLFNLVKVGTPVLIVN